MARPKKWPPTIHAHKRGYDYFRWNGDEYYLGPSGTEASRDEYLRQLALLSGGDKQAAAPRRHKATVAEVLAVWLAHAKEIYSKRGREYENHCRSVAPLGRLFGPIPAADFGPRLLKKVREAMVSGIWRSEKEKATLAKMKKPIGLSRKVANQRVNRIRTAWRWLESEEWLPAGSHAALMTVTRLRKGEGQARSLPKRKPVPWKVLAKVCRKCSRTVRAMLLVQYFSGMRPGEVRIMRAGNIDRGRPTWLYWPGLYKGDWREDDTDKAVSLGPVCRKILAPLLAGKAESDYLFQPDRIRKEPIYTDQTFVRAVERACAKAGVKLTAYQLRHACKERATQAGGLDAARAMLGQRSLGTTNEYGSQRDLKIAQGIAERIG